MKKKLIKAFVLTFAAVALVVASVVGTMAFLTSSAAVANTFTVGKVFIHMYESAVNDNGTKKDPSEGINGSMKTSAGNVYNLMPGNTYVKDPTIYVDAESQSSYLFLKVRNDIRSIEEGIVKFETISFVKNTEGQYTHAHVVERKSETETKEYDLQIVTLADGTPRIKEENSMVFEYGSEKVFPLTMRAQMELKGWKYHHENLNVVVYVYAYEPGSSNTDAAKPVGGSGQKEEVDVFDRFAVRGDVTDISIFGAARVSLVAYAVQAEGFGDVGSQESVNAAWQAIVELYPYESGEGFGGSTP